METLLRTLRLLAVVIWVGGIAFFAFVLAPVAFHVLPTTHEAGLVVGGALAVLNQIGFSCGFIFLMATPFVHSPRSVRAQAALVLLMLALTAYLDFSVLPRMERDRASTGGDITAASPDNLARIDFDRLHPLSEKLEGAVLLAGLGVIWLLAVESKPGLP